MLKKLQITEQNIQELSNSENEEYELTLPMQKKQLNINRYDLVSFIQLSYVQISFITLKPVRKHTFHLTHLTLRKNGVSYWPL